MPVALVLGTTMTGATTICEVIAAVCAFLYMDNLREAKADPMPTLRAMRHGHGWQMKKAHHRNDGRWLTNKGQVLRLPTLGLIRLIGIHGIGDQQIGAVPPVVDESCQRRRGPRVGRQHQAQAAPGRTLHRVREDHAAACLHALESFDGPITIGLQSGHMTSHNRSIPLGTWVTMEDDTLSEIKQ